MKNQLLVTLNVEEFQDLINKSILDAISQIPHPVKENEEVLLKKKDLAKLFSVSLVTIREWMKMGKLPYYRINSRIFFKKNEVLDVLQNNHRNKGKSNE